MLQQGPQGGLKMESMRKNINKKGILEFLIFFSVVDVVVLCMYLCMKIAEYKALQFGTKIIKIHVSWI